MKTRHIIFIVVAIITLSAAFFVGILNYNASGIEGMIRNHYSQALLIYIALIAAAAATTLPISIVLIAGLIFFTPLEALLYAFLAVYLGSLVIYLISIGTGKDILDNYAKGSKKLKALHELLHESPFSMVLFLNLVYFFPSNLGHMISGVVKLNFWKFSTATTVGNYPNIFGVWLLIIGIESLNYIYIIASIIILILVTAIPLYVHRKHMRALITLAFSYKTYLKFKKAEKFVEKEETEFLKG